MFMCIFCGAHNPVNHKQLPYTFVSSMLQKQKEAGIADPVLHFMQNMLAGMLSRHEGAEDEGAAGGDCGGSSRGSSCGELGELQLSSCMCCYYWVTRRSHMRIIPLPMQNLLWFVRQLSWCEGGKCDCRILQRLATTVTEADNAFARLFEAYELRGLGAIVDKHRGHKAQGGKSQSAQRFNMKRELAGLWSEWNGHSLLLPSGEVADLMRLG